MERVAKVLGMVVVVVLVLASNVEGGRLLKEENVNVDHPQNFPGSGGLGGIFPSPSPGFSFTGVGFGPSGFCTFPGGCTGATPSFPTIPGAGGSAPIIPHA